MKTFSALSVAALLFLGTGAETAEAQSFGGIHIGNRDFNIGIHVGNDRHRRGRGRHVSHRRHSRSRHYGRRPVHRHSRHCRLVTRPGHWDHVRDRVWHAAVTYRVWVEPVYDDGCDRYGASIRVLVRSGYYRNEVVPGYWENSTRRVWVPGRSHHSCGY